MDNIFKKLILFLVVVCCIVLAVNQNKPVPVNWEKSYDRHDKNPYGTYILDQELPVLLPFDSLVRTQSDLYSFLTSGEIDTLRNSNILMIGPLDAIDEPTVKRLFSYVEKGNTAMILMPYLSNALTDTLDIDMKYSSEASDLNYYQLTNENLSHQQFSYDIIDQYFIDIPDSARTKVRVLGNRITRTKQGANLIQVPIGKGKIILGINPMAFTNYFLLESNNHLYAQSVLSYLPEQTTYYFVKPDTNNLDKEQNSNSIMRFVFNNPPLKWAWRLFLASMILFIVFTAKRKQKIIPIIAPLKNNSLDFVKTISNLYIDNKDYSNIIQKSIFYTLEKIRNKYAISTKVLDQTFIEQFAKKSGKDPKDIKAFAQFVNQFNKNQQIGNKNQLLELNTLTQKIIDYKI